MFSVCCGATSGSGAGADSIIGGEGSGVGAGGATSGMGAATGTCTGEQSWVAASLITPSSFFAVSSPLLRRVISCWYVSSEISPTTCWIS